MEHLLKSVESALAAENWYAALALTLTLPDIAGKIDASAQKSSGATYAKWFDKYIGQRYQVPGGYAAVGEQPEVETMMDRYDCYALRCAYLHEGISDVTAHSAARNVSDFMFFGPGHARFHLNHEEGVLQLMADEFCKEIIDGVRTWLRDISEDTKKTAALDNYLRLFIIGY